MTTTRTRKIAAALIALTLVGGIAASIPAEAATTPTRYVTVNSDGSVKVTPDAVRLNANVTVVAGSNKEALAQTSTSAAAVRAALTKAGIAKADIARWSNSQPLAHLGRKRRPSRKPARLLALVQRQPARV